MGDTPQAIDQMCFNRCFMDSAKFRRSNTQVNQYHIVLETQPEFQKNPSKLRTSTCVLLWLQLHSPLLFRSQTVTATTSSAIGLPLLRPALPLSPIRLSAPVSPILARSNRNGGAGSPQRLYPLRNGRASALASVNHRGNFPSSPSSFNLAPGASLGEATKAIRHARASRNWHASQHAPSGAPQRQPAPLGRFKPPVERAAIGILAALAHGLYRPWRAL